RHHVDLSAPAPFGALSGKVAEAWMFPPALTLQYHFTGLGNFKPYVGAGVQYIHFFSEKTGSNTLNATGVSIDDAFGVTLQAGFDLALGSGWYLNADVKKTWLDTKATWHTSAVTGGDIVAKVDVDPLIVSAGLGYRFNLEDLLGRRTATAPLK
ncbi:MAG: OmpW family protein, partial [Hyphomicrobiaceae bacterium]